MKTKFFSIMAAAALLASGVSSCSDNWEPDVKSGSGNGTGRLRTATFGVEVTNGEILVKDGLAPLKAPKSRASIDLTDFIVKITGTDGKEAGTWSYGQMLADEFILLNTGDYTVDVASAEAPEAAGWNCPYFTGSQRFSIAENKITDVEPVVCTLGNVMVTIHFTNQLLAEAADDIKVTVTSTEGNSLTFTPSTPAADAGYFASTGDENETLKVKFTGTISGTAETFANAILDVKPGQHRKITFGLKKNDAVSPDENGYILVDGTPISVDTSVESEDLTVDNAVEDDILDPSGRPGQEVLPEEPGPDQPGPDQPTPADAISFTSETIKLDGSWNKVSDFSDEDMNPIQDAKLVIAADNKLAHLYVTIDACAELAPIIAGMGMGEEFDLAYPGDLKKQLTEFKFPLEGDVIGQTEVTFDITEFVPLLGIYPGQNKFVIRAVDQSGNEKSQEMKFE
ncbi:MAG: DUF4493 domain-containing protein [Muribaculaceae bacterium]|nr:DUF4493 domain-containing protein [Muribaculaceae bacterium]